MDPATVASALSVALKVLEKGIQINAAGAEAKSVLKSVEQVSGQLTSATTLRRQKSTLLTKFEKQMIDDSIKIAQDTISQVASLVEPARADLEVSGGSVRLQTRLLFVLRDSSRIQACLTQLGIASQSLNRDLIILCGRGGPCTSSMCSSASVKPAPPPYEEVVFLTEHRRRNLQIRSRSTLSLPATLASPQATSAPSIVSDIEDPPMRQELEDQQHSVTGNTDEKRRSRDRTQLRGGRQRSLRWLDSRTG